jgi:hypothetical protein
MSVSEARVNASSFRKCRAMVSPRMLLTISAALFSTDYPFHQPGAAVKQFFDAIPDRCDRAKIASGNAQTLFRLAWPDAPGR